VRTKHVHEQLGNSAEVLRAASELRRIVELEARLTGEAEGPRKPEIIVRIRKDFGASDDDPSAYDELRYGHPQSVMALPAGEKTANAEYEDCAEVMQ